MKLAVLPLCVSILLVAGGGATPADTPRGDHVPPVAGTPPRVAEWRPFLVTPSDVIDRVPAPRTEASLATETDDLRRVRTARTASDARADRAWETPAAVRWSRLACDLVRSRRTSPPEASRAFALASVAMYDAAVLTARLGRARPRPRPSDLDPSLAAREATDAGRDPAGSLSYRVAVSAAAAEALGHLFPGDRARVLRLLSSSIHAELATGDRFRADIEAGAVLGAAVGARVVEARRRDGSAGPDPVYEPFPARGRWRPTGGADVSPLLPRWGAVRPWLLASGDAFRPPAPPSATSDEWARGIEEVRLEVATGPIEHRVVAERWAGGPGTATPAGIWCEIACDLVARARLDEASAALVLAALGTAQADAFVACWDCKYAYDVCRPVTAIRETTDPEWTPPIATPPFPSYPSGHATTSAAAAQVLACFFPSSAMELMRKADEAASSRLYGGIHTRLDNDVGAAMGRIVGGVAVARFAHDWASR
jgi:hypothetical protein